jgi:hypothetical protein
VIGNDRRKRLNFILQEKKVFSFVLLGLSFFLWVLFLTFFFVFCFYETMKLLATEQEVDGVELFPEDSFLLTNAGKKSGGFIGVIIGDGVTAAVHHDHELAVDLTAEDGEVRTKTLLGAFVHDVPCPRCRKRGGDFAEAPVGGLLGVDARNPTSVASRRKTKRRRAFMLCHQATKLRACRTGSRTCVHGEELGVGLTCPHIPVRNELEVDGRVVVPEVATVEAEAVRVHGVGRTPALDIAIAEEVHLRDWTTRDTSCETGRFASCTMVDDLLRSDGECRRHFAEGGV